MDRVWGRHDILDWGLLLVDERVGVRVQEVVRDSTEFYLQDRLDVPVAAPIFVQTLEDAIGRTRI